jgi:hypothetical protein
MLKVKDHAVSARFIKEVYNYIILDNDTRWRKNLKLLS